jgi:hypothetical protein
LARPSSPSPEPFIHLFAPLTAADRDALEIEGAGLLLFHAPDVKRRRIEISGPHRSHPWIAGDGERA